MKDKRKILFFIVIALAITTLLIIRPSTKNITAKYETKKDQHPKKQSKWQDRSIASVPQAKKVKKIANRVVIGDQKAEKISYSNSVSKDWKTNYAKHFNRMLYGQKVQDFKVKVKRSVVQVKNSIGRNLEHVIVSYKKPNGDPFAFEALIDSETGMMVQSWNKTRYEFKRPYKIEGSKYKYQAN